MEGRFGSTSYPRKYYRGLKADVYRGSPVCGGLPSLKPLLAGERGSRVGKESTPPGSGLQLHPERTYHIPTKGVPPILEKYQRNFIDRGESRCPDMDS